jgi:MOSC domain-containing protein YiiM
VAVLVAINISPGGIPKLPIPKGEVTRSGLVGDGRDHAKHLKPARSLSLLDEEIIGDLRREGYPVEPGALGENLTVRDLHAQSLPAGTRLRFAGGVTLELTEPRKPCFVLDAVDPRLKETTVGRIGWMARVINPGWLSAGEAVVVEGPRPPCS